MIKRPKGTYDLFGEDSKKWQYMESVIKKILKTYDFNYLRTPTFEETNLFKRDDEKSEMVTKQTYDFEDKSGRKITLRPENTAGAIRAIIENKLYLEKNKNFYYIGSNFRYERPQKGRFREFFQFGIEVINDRDYLVDFNVLLIASKILKTLKIKSTLLINNIGSESERAKYNKELSKYFTKYQEKLCPDCKERLSNNTLRILDCKVCSSNQFFKKAPKISDFLGKDSKEYLNKIERLLKEYKINYKYDTNLVRGLDYYSDLVFEFISSENQALCGGGRYNNLIKDLGGPDVGGIGFAFGLERLLNSFTFNDNDKLRCFIISDTLQKDYSYRVLNKIRDSNFYSKLDYSDRNFGKKLKSSLKEEPDFLIFIKDEEEKNKTVTIKNTKTQKQETIKEKDLIDYLNKFYKGNENA